MGNAKELLFALMETDNIESIEMPEPVKVVLDHTLSEDKVQTVCEEIKRICEKCNMSVTVVHNTQERTI